MSFNNKFRAQNPNNAPQGVNIEHSSFGYAQNQKPYVKPAFGQEAVNTQKTKPGGGWGDDEDDEPQQIRGNSGPFNRNAPTGQTSQQGAFKAEIKSPASATSSNTDDLGLGPATKKALDNEIVAIDEKFLAKNDYENKTINDLIQPGGARLKQPDNVLANFCKACESFQASVTGSLLLSKLQEDIPYVSKARTLFLIDAVVKKVKKHFEYFKYNINVLKFLDFSNEGPNAQQLTKLKDDIVSYIENPNKSKQPPIIPVQQPNLMSPTTINNPIANILDDNDLLGGSSPPQKNAGATKQDPFAFMKPQAQPSFNQPQVINQNQNFELLDIQQSQPVVQQQNQQAKKFNPFDLGNSSPNVVQNTNKPPSAGLPGSFKKFQAAGTSTSTPNNSFTPEQNPVQAAPTNQQNFNQPPKATLDQLDDLLENFNGLDFGGNQSGAQVTQQNQGGLSSQNIPANKNVAQQPQGLNNLNAQSPQSFNNGGLLAGNNQQSPNVGFQQPQTQGFQQPQNQGFKQPQNQVFQQPQNQGFQQPQNQGFQQSQNQGFQQPQNQGFQQPQNQGFQQPQNLGFQQNLGANNKVGFPNQQAPYLQNQVAPNQFNQVGQNLPGYQNTQQQQQGQNQLNKGFSGAQNQQFYPQYQNQAPGAFAGHNGNPQWNGGYPQQGAPQGYNYQQGQNFGGFGQPQPGFTPQFNSAPQQQFNSNSFQGQPNMYGKPQFQGQQDGGFQGQYGKK